MLPSDRHDFLICWVVIRLHPERDFRPRGLQIAHQSRLLRPGSKDQDVVAGLDGLGDCRKKFWIRTDMTRADFVGMVMEVRRGEMGVHYCGTDAGGSQRK